MTVTRERPVTVYSVFRSGDGRIVDITTDAAEAEQHSRAGRRVYAGTEAMTVSLEVGR